MSKKKQIENLAAFIGLKAAHEILIKVTNKPESVPHLKKEVDTYSDLSFDLADGNWNNEDIEKIKKLAKNRCSKKLEKYGDIGSKKYNEVDGIISNIMADLGLI